MTAIQSCDSSPARAGVGITFASVYNKRLPMRLGLHVARGRAVVFAHTKAKHPPTGGDCTQRPGPSQGSTRGCDVVSMLNIHNCSVAHAHRRTRIGSK